MRKKLGKEKKLLNNDYFRVKYGTVDAYNFESVYKTKVIEQMLSNHPFFFKILFCCFF